MSAPDPETGSTETLWFMCVVGLVLQVIGFSMAVLQAPRTEVTDVGVVQEGDRELMLVALHGFGLGSVLSLIAVIGFGVLLGMGAHDRG